MPSGHCAGWGASFCCWLIDWFSTALCSGAFFTTRYFWLDDDLLLEDGIYGAEFWLLLLLTKTCGRSCLLSLLFSRLSLLSALGQFWGVSFSADSCWLLQLFLLFEMKLLLTILSELPLRLSHSDNCSSYPTVSPFFIMSLDPLAWLTEQIWDFDPSLRPRFPIWWMLPSPSFDFDFWLCIFWLTGSTSSSLDFEISYSSSGITDTDADGRDLSSCRWNSVWDLGGGATAAYDCFSSSPFLSLMISTLIWTYPLTISIISRFF